MWICGLSTRGSPQAAHSCVHAEVSPQYSHCTPCAGVTRCWAISLMRAQSRSSALKSESVMSVLLKPLSCRDTGERQLSASSYPTYVNRYFRIFSIFFPLCSFLCCDSFAAFTVCLLFSSFRRDWFPRPRVIIQSVIISFHHFIYLSNSRPCR